MLNFFFRVEEALNIIFFHCVNVYILGDILNIHDDKYVSTLDEVGLRCEFICCLFSSEYNQCEYIIDSKYTAVYLTGIILPNLTERLYRETEAEETGYAISMCRLSA